MSSISENRSRVRGRVIAEPGLTHSEARATLRRQFIGSVAAAVVVMAMTGLAAMRSAHEDSTAIRGHSLTVQQPGVVSPSDRLIALRQR